MTERFLVTAYDEQDNGDLIRRRTIEIFHDDILRMNGIEPVEFWAWSEAMQKKVIAEIWSGVDPSETIDNAQAVPRAVN